MVNKFISQFWVLSAKSVRFNKHTKYTLNIEKYINEKLKGESAIDDLCTNFRRIRMDSIELYEETVNNNFFSASFSKYSTSTQDTLLLVPNGGLLRRSSDC